MSTRTTRADCEAVMRTLARMAGATVADPDWSSTDPGREGAWSLDYASILGGYVVVAYAADWPSDADRPQAYTAYRYPLWDDRSPAREFHDRCYSAIRALDFVRAAGASMTVPLITDAEARAFARNLFPSFAVRGFVRSGQITPWFSLRAAGLAAQSACPFTPLTDAEQAAFVAYIRHHGPRGPVEGWGS